MMKVKQVFFNIFLALVAIVMSANIASGAIDQSKIVGLWLFDESEGNFSSSQFNRQCKTINTLDLFTEKVTKQS